MRAGWQPLPLPLLWLLLLMGWLAGSPLLWLLPLPLLLPLLLLLLLLIPLMLLLCVCISLKTRKVEFAVTHMLRVLHRGLEAALMT